MTKELLVPVRFDGGMLHDTDYHKGAIDLQALLNDRAEQMYLHGHTKWAATYYMAVIPEFQAQLRLVGHYKNGNSAYLIFEDQTGSTWPMFLGDAVTFLGHADLSQGFSRVTTFETIKRGKAYAIRMVTHAMR